MSAPDVHNSDRAAAPSASIGARVQSLIEEHHGGNVARAAAFLKIPRRSLAHIVSSPLGYSPRLKTAAKIATTYGVRLEWILTGRGEKAAPRRPLRVTMSDGRVWSYEPAMARGDCSFIEHRQHEMAPHWPAAFVALLHTPADVILAGRIASGETELVEVEP